MMQQHNRVYHHQQRHSATNKHYNVHPSRDVILYPTLNRRDDKPFTWAGTSTSRNSPRCPAHLLPPPPPPKTPPSRPTRMVPPRVLISPPHPHRVTTSLIPRLRYERIGNPNLRIFRLRLPSDMMHLLDDIVSHADRHVSRLPGGWNTELYSLTKQDYALRDIPGMAHRIRPIHEYVCKTIQILFGCRKVVVDKNQPHILKYSLESGHTGVELHHDRCDVTANLALSRSQDYKGGGTWFPDLGRVVRLEKGEFLLHPGSLVHGGMDVSAGQRYLMVTFAHLH